MKAIELSGVHVGRKIKISYITARANGVYHEFWAVVEKVYHNNNGSIVVSQYWYTDPTFKTSGVTYPNYMGIPYYADVEVLN